MFGTGTALGDAGKADAPECAEWQGLLTSPCRPVQLGRCAIRSVGSGGCAVITVGAEVTGDPAVTADWVNLLLERWVNPPQSSPIASCRHVFQRQAT